LGQWTIFFLHQWLLNLALSCLLVRDQQEEKKFLLKFLDLEMFERKFKLAKDDASDLRGMLKRLEGTEFDEQIEEVNEKLVDIENEIKNKKTLVKK
jgi:hypothetical protein